jgi:predicted Zn-dependent protease
LKLAKLVAVFCTALLSPLFASVANAQQSAASPAPKPAAAPADPAALIRAGHFAEAEQADLRIIAKDPHNFTALVQLGQVALLANHLDDADKWLAKAHAANPSNAGPK